MRVHVTKREREKLMKHTHVRIQKAFSLSVENSRKGKEQVRESKRKDKHFSVYKIVQKHKPRARRASVPPGRRQTRVAVTRSRGAHGRGSSGGRGGHMKLCNLGHGRDKLGKREPILGSPRPAAKHDLVDGLGTFLGTI